MSNSRKESSCTKKTLSAPRESISMQSSPWNVSKALDFKVSTENWSDITVYHKQLPDQCVVLYTFLITGIFTSFLQESCRKRSSASVTLDFYLKMLALKQSLLTQGRHLHIKGFAMGKAAAWILFISVERPSWALEWVKKPKPFSASYLKPESAV